MMMVMPCLLLTSFGLVGAARMNPFEPFRSRSRALNSLMATGGPEDLYQLCDNPETHLFHAHSVSITPIPPTTGQDIVVVLDVESNKTVTGGQVDVEFHFGIIKVTKQLDLCETLEMVQSDTRCPAEAGRRKINVKRWIPPEFPALTVKGTVRVYDQDHAMLTCVSVNFKIERPAS
jgi:hypothetical protein